MITIKISFNTPEYKDSIEQEISVAKAWKIIQIISPEKFPSLNDFCDKWVKKNANQ